MVQLDDDEVKQIVTFLKVLADRSRFRVLALLSEREYSVKELAAALELKEPTVSAHLTMLKNHNMVDARPVGTTRLYRLRQEGVYELLKTLRDKMPTEATEATTPDAWERDILNHFFQDGKLKEIPTQPKKRLVALRHLAQGFEPGQSYTEREVNEILKRFHPDCAALRRYLVDERLMARERGVYQRVMDEGTREE